MDKIFLTLFIIGSAALLIYLSLIWRTIRTLSAKADESWQQLLGLLSERHGVILLLTDAIGSFSGEDPGTMALATATERAKSHLSALERSIPNLDGLSVAEHQTRVRESLDNVTLMIESDPSLSNHKPVAGCLQGVTELTEKVKLALLAYNDAAITYTSYVNSWDVSQLTKLTKAPRSYQLLDWVPTSSSMSPATARVPRPAGLMRNGNVPCDDSDG